MPSSWLKTIPPSAATGRLREIYSQVASPDGQVDHVYQAQSLRPETIRGHDQVYRSALHFENPVCPPWFLEAVAVYTSSLNRCSYAVEHHFANMRHLLADVEQAARILEAIKKDEPDAVFTGKELHLLMYARKLTVRPGEMQRADIEQLRRLGAGDEEILEVNQVAAAFNYSNRVINGLGVELCGERIGYYGSD